MAPRRDSTLADPQQVIANLPRQVAERDAALDVALSREAAAAAEVLQVINASPGDLAPVFDAILEKALRLCEAEIGTLWTYEGHQARVEANRGAPPAYAEFLKQGPHPLPANAASVIHFPDITQ